MRDRRLLALDIWRCLNVGLSLLLVLGLANGWPQLTVQLMCAGMVISNLLVIVIERHVRAS